MIRISKAFANIDVGVAMLFQAITNTNIKYPAWFCKGKTPLLRKPGEFNAPTSGDAGVNGWSPEGMHRM